MSKYSWDATLDVGVEEMNGEHRVLIDKMNHLYDLYASGAPFDGQVAALDDLLAYAVEHFDDEEWFMEASSFPEIEQHKTIHRLLVEKLGEHRGKAVEAGTLDDKFFNFLGFWIVTHIKGVDTKYGQFVGGLA